MKAKRSIDGQPTQSTVIMSPGLGGLPE